MSQINADARKHGIELLNYNEQVFSSFLGRLIYEDCKVSMEKPMKLLAMFEKAGEMAELNEEFLQWTVPLTNFPVVQHYTEGTVKKVWVQYGPPEGPKESTEHYHNTLQLHVSFDELPIPCFKKQSSGASPNIIHSLDAAHLMLVVDRCPFSVTTVHDSFGALLGDMSELFVIIRETFVELHSQEPLKSIMKDIKGDINEVEMGTLDINLVLQSEYAFS